MISISVQYSNLSQRNRFSEEKINLLVILKSAAQYFLPCKIQVAPKKMLMNMGILLLAQMSVFDYEQGTDRALWSVLFETHWNCKK